MLALTAIQPLAEKNMPTRMSTAKIIATINEIILPNKEENRARFKAPGTQLPIVKDRDSF